MPMFVYMWRHILWVFAIGGAHASFTCSTKKSAICTALGDMYTSTNGASWTNNTGWSLAARGNATDYCTFRGVTCRNGKLTEMNLSYNNLVGSLPSTWLKSTFVPGLTKLNLTGNAMCGPELLEMKDMCTTVVCAGVLYSPCPPPPSPPSPPPRPPPTPSRVVTRSPLAHHWDASTVRIDASSGKVEIPDIGSNGTSMVLSLSGRAS